MEPNQNPPSERKWTIEEREEFFASQDAVTGLFNGSVASNAVWLPEVGYFDISDLERLLDPGIHVTHIVPSGQGWPIAAHCSLCKKTEIILSPYALKPENGDFYLLKGTCLDEELCVKHNLWPQYDYPWPNKEPQK